MIKVENIEVFNFEGAIRGLRNPMNSWDKSDSFRCIDRLDCDGCPCEGVDDTCNSPVDKLKDVIVGQNDLDLMRRLYKAGTEHRKYLRQIFVSMDITAPLYWWKEADTYKVGTVANSCSTMHKIHSKKFTVSDFSCEQMTEDITCEAFRNTIKALNFNRDMFLETKDKKWWWNMIQSLPSSYNQRRTVTMNYENVMTIIKQRSGHKLDEWNQFVETLKGLPYITEIMEN